MELADGAFDLIVCNDVLEHLSDPWTVLRSLRDKLTAQGKVCGSIPNIAHVSIAKNLLLRKEFPYADHGLLDRTHRWFFTKKSIYAMLVEAGYCVERLVGMNRLEHAGFGIVNALALGFFTDNSFLQYFFAAAPRR